MGGKIAITENVLSLQRGWHWDIGEYLLRKELYLDNSCWLDFVWKRIFFSNQCWKPHWKPPFQCNILPKTNSFNYRYLSLDVYIYFTFASLFGAWIVLKLYRLWTVFHNVTDMTIIVPLFYIITLLFNNLSQMIWSIWLEV